MKSRPTRTIATHASLTYAFVAAVIVMLAAAFMMSSVPGTFLSGDLTPSAQDTTLPGVFVSLDSSGNAYGWAYDTTSTIPVKVDLWADGLAGQGTPITLGIVSNMSGGNGGSNAWRFTVPAKYSGHSIVAVAVGANNRITYLYGSPKNVTFTSGGSTGNSIVTAGTCASKGGLCKWQLDQKGKTCSVPFVSAGDCTRCCVTGTPKSACSDGIDNDGDGKIDYPADPGCSSASDTDETDASVCNHNGTCDPGETTANCASDCTTIPPTKVVSCQDTDGPDGRNIAVNGFVTFTFDNGQKLTIDENKYIRTGSPIDLSNWPGQQAAFWNNNTGFPTLGDPEVFLRGNQSVACVDGASNGFGYPFWEGDSRYSFAISTPYQWEWTCTPQEGKDFKSGFAAFNDTAYSYYAFKFSSFNDPAAEKKEAKKFTMTNELNQVDALRQRLLSVQNDALNKAGISLQTANAAGLYKYIDFISGKSGERCTADGSRVAIGN